MDAAIHGSLGVTHCHSGSTGHKPTAYYSKLVISNHSHSVGCVSKHCMCDVSMSCGRATIVLSEKVTNRIILNSY